MHGITHDPCQQKCHLIVAIFDQMKPLLEHMEMEMEMEMEMDSTVNLSVMASLLYLINISYVFFNSQHRRFIFFCLLQFQELRLNKLLKYYERK